MAHTKTTQVDMLSEHIGVYNSASPEKIQVFNADRHVLAMVQHLFYEVLQ